MGFLKQQESAQSITLISLKGGASITPLESQSYREKG